MEKINFNYSLQNIPTLTKKSYQLMLIEKIESFINRMRWKARFYLKNGTSNIAYRNHGLRQGTNHRNEKNYKTLKKAYWIP